MFAAKVDGGGVADHLRGERKMSSSSSGGGGGGSALAAAVLQSQGGGGTKSKWMKAFKGIKGGGKDEKPEPAMAMARAVADAR